MQIRHELRPLTSARGIAAWYVVLYHVRLSASGTLPQGVIDFLAKGYLAVDFFFVLSGFVIWLNYRALLEENCNRVIWLEHGKVKMDGPPKEVTRNYFGKS